MRRFSLWIMMVIGCCSFSIEFAFANTTVTLKQPVTFINVGGSSVTLDSGNYHVRSVSPWLELVPEGKTRREAVLLQAQPIRHSETFRSPSVRYQELGQKGELVFFLPRGRGLKALGSLEQRPSRRFATQASTPHQAAIPLTRRAVEDSQKKSLPPKFIPNDPWDKALFAMIQTLQSRVNTLEEELATLKHQYTKHQHKYTVPVFGEGGAAWVTIQQLRNMKDNTTQSLDNYGMYFRGKANSQKPLPPKDTSGPKH